MIHRKSPSAVYGFSKPISQAGVGFCFYATRGLLPRTLDPLSIALVWTRRKHLAVLFAQGTGSLTHTFLAN